MFNLCCCCCRGAASVELLGLSVSDCPSTAVVAQGGGKVVIQVGSPAVTSYVSVFIYFYAEQDIATHAVCLICA
jgi:hypothetical protein